MEGSGSSSRRPHLMVPHPSARSSPEPVALPLNGHTGDEPSREARVKCDTLMMDIKFLKVLLERNTPGMLLAVRLLRVQGEPPTNYLIEMRPIGVTNYHCR